MPSQTILGIRFFHGTPAEAVRAAATGGGLVVAPSGTCFERFLHDADYHRAIITADLALPDSGLMVTLWRLTSGRALPRISGLAYLKALLGEIDLREVLWVLPNERSREKLIAWAAGNPEVRGQKSEVRDQRSEVGSQRSEVGPPRSPLPAPRSELPARSSHLQAPSSELPAPRSNLPSPTSHLPISPSDCYLAPIYGASVSDETLLQLLETRRPRHVIIAIGAGAQEKLGWYLREHASARPAIHCIGGALGFVTGDQVAIPDWADRLYLGWLLRLLTQPRVFLPRLWKARHLPWLVWRYRGKNPKC